MAGEQVNYHGNENVEEDLKKKKSAIPNS